MNEKINPQSLRPAALMRLLNTAGFGTVLPEHRLRRHRNRAGYQIGTDKTINLFKYAAWLTLEYFRERPPEIDYVEKKRLQTIKSAEAVRAAQDIGALPTVDDPQRKAASLASFKTFCETYFGEVFYLPWSQDHLRIIEKMERAVRYGGLFAMAMPRGTGKALALDTPIPTPKGWTTMESLQIGDEVFDDKGNVCHVTFATEIQHGRDCFCVEFSDGEQIICDGDHLWTVNDPWSRRNPLTLTTRQMSSRVVLSQKRGWTEYRYRIPLAESLQLPDGVLPIDPYTLGIWLGDGRCNSSHVTLNGDDTEEICLVIDESAETTSIKNFRFEIGNACNLVLTQDQKKKNSFQGRLRTLGLLGNKHIPSDYLRSSHGQRLALLQGIMDTDGHIDENGGCEIVIKYPSFAESFGELLSSLGIKYGRGEKWVEGEKLYGPYYRFFFAVHNDFQVFQLQRKLDRLKPRPRTQPLCKGRKIVDIKPVPSVPVRCIQVDSPSKLYLAGKKMIPTHNTVLCQVAVVWAALAGAAPFVCLIAASAERAQNLLENIKTWLETNALLQADFPEVCFPIKCLERIANRQKGQKHLGEPTRIEWSADKVVLPTIEGSKASGVVISCSGMHGSEIRGQQHARPDGRVERPSLVLIDDPQTTESAWSRSQSQRRESILAGDVLGMAGPGKKIAGLMACTIIRPGDMASAILDREKHPDWQGERTKLVYSFPKNDKLWAKYAEIRSDSLRNDGDGSAATEFYREHRLEMDEGALIAWPERFNSDEISALQHAMNLKFRDELAFQSEYQNEPQLEDLGEEMLTEEQISSKTNGYQRCLVPASCQHLTMFVDVHQNALYWMIVGWESNFTGYLVDYGTWPDQHREYFMLRDCQKTIQHVTGGPGLEASIYAALEKLAEERLDRIYFRDDGTEMRIDRCLIDSNWGQTTDVVYQFCRQSSHAAILFPSHGQYVGATSLPFAAHKKQRGDRIGHHWRIPGVVGARPIRHVMIDTNYWKTFVHARLGIPMGDPGCLSLFGHEAKRHRFLAEHLTAEYRVRTIAYSRTVDEWKTRPSRPDNHWFDCLVGCAVAASIQGAELITFQSKNEPSRPRIKLSDRQFKRRIL